MALLMMGTTIGSRLTGLLQLTKWRCARLRVGWRGGGGARMTSSHCWTSGRFNIWWISGSWSACGVELWAVVSSWYQFGCLWSLVELCGHCLLLNKLWSMARKSASSSLHFNRFLSCAKHSLSKWDAVRWTSRGSDSNRRWQEQHQRREEDAKDMEKLQVFRHGWSINTKRCYKSRKEGRRRRRTHIVREYSWHVGTSPEGAGYQGTCCAISYATLRTRRKQVKRAARNMARTAVIAAGAFLGVTQSANSDNNNELEHLTRVTEDLVCCNTKDNR